MFYWLLPFGLQWLLWWWPGASAVDGARVLATVGAMLAQALVLSLLAALAAVVVVGIVVGWALAFARAVTTPGRTGLH